MIQIQNHHASAVITFTDDADFRNNGVLCAQTIQGVMGIDVETYEITDGKIQQSSALYYITNEENVQK